MRLIFRETMAEGVKRLGIVHDPRRPQEEAPPRPPQVEQVASPHRVGAPRHFLNMLGVFAEFETMTACRSLDFQIEFAHQRAPRRFFAVDVGGIVLRGAGRWCGSLGREPRAHIIR
jgi:hypothetical protein